MTTNLQNRFIAVLIGLLVAVVAVQSAFLVKLYRRSTAPETHSVAVPAKIDLHPKAGTGQPPLAGALKWNPPAPAAPFGGLGLDPGTWDPFEELRSMRQQMDQMFNDSFGRFRQSPDFDSLWGGDIFSPSMDVEEKGGNYVVRMDIPGADKSNISVRIDDRQLVVSGKVDETVEEKGQNQLRKERRSGEFMRSLTLPGPVNSDEMEATSENGVLTIMVPKAEEQGRSRSIEVK